MKGVSIIERCKNCKKYLCDDKCQKRSDKKKIKCECSGYVSSTNNVLIDIFPDGRSEGSRINIRGRFTATTINPPNCFTNSQGTYLTTGGAGIVTSDGFLYEGSYALGLQDLSDGTDRFTLSFIGSSTASGLAISQFINGSFTDGTLSIKQCVKDCKCGKNPNIPPGNLPPGLPPFTTMLNLAQLNSTMFKNSKNNTIRTVTLLPNGEVEINEDSI